MFAAAIALLLTAATGFADGAKVDPALGLDPKVAAATVRIELQHGKRVGDCTGVLVAADVVATAAHCALGEAPTAMRFYIDGEKRTGLEFIARGMTITDVDTGTAARGKDWLLVRIAPVTQAPLTVASLVEIERARAQAAEVEVVSYAGNKLHTLSACTLLTLPLEGFFAMTCKVRDGDSGGPIVLPTADGPRLIGLVYAQGKKVSIGTSASQFSHLIH